MATIKSYTDLSQSKTLSKILPLESADMYYFLDPTPLGNIYIPSLVFIEKHLKSRMPEYDKGDIPCWSLAALLGALPNGIVIHKDTNNGKYHCSSTHIGTYVTASNPLNALYEMILKLHEFKML